MNNSTNVKRVNLLSILHGLKTAGPVSAAALAKSTRLSAMTVGKLLAVLGDAGITRVAGAQAAPIGRHAALYELNPEYGVLLGLGLKRSGITEVLLDFSGRIRMTRSFPCDIARQQDTLRLLAARTAAAAEQYGSALLGVGISVPGRTDKAGKIILMPEYPMWNGFELAGVLQQTAGGAPVYADNDTNALALAVKWHPELDSGENFAYLTFDDGVGVGVVNQGRVFYGAHSRGCEIGHITLDPEGPLCRCGKRGCLQAYVTCNENDAADRRRAARYIGIGAANTASLLDPEKIFIQSGLLSRWPALHSEAVCPVPFTLVENPALFDAAPASIAVERLMTGDLLSRIL